MCDLKQLDFPEDFQTYYLLTKTKKFWNQKNNSCDMEPLEFKICKF